MTTISLDTRLIFLYLLSLVSLIDTDNNEIISTGKMYSLSPSMIFCLSILICSGYEDLIKGVQMSDIPKEQRKLVTSIMGHIKFYNNKAKLDFSFSSLC